MALKLQPGQVQAILDQVDGLLPQAQAALEDLVRIPSVNFPGHDQSPVQACVDKITDLLGDADVDDIQHVDTGTGAPAIVASVPGPPDTPMVLLYAHYDVQPPGDLEAWASPPFEPTRRGSRLYGRGAADDKSGVVTHITALRAFGGRPPVNIRVIFEGEEENGGDLDDWPFTHSQYLADVDAAVLADMGNAALGLPSFTTQVRGIIEGIVTVNTLAGPVHSGAMGGPAPDALMVLIKLLSSLMDDDGNCAVEGLGGFEWDGPPVHEHVYREAAGILPDQPLIGTGSVASRLFSKPSATVVGIDAPGVTDAANAIIPSARAKVSVRIPPEVDATAGTAALAAHLHRQAPFGVRADFVPGADAAGAKVPLGGPAYRACAAAMEAVYRRRPVNHGVGGTVPLIANLLEAFPGIEVIGVGAQDPAARIHAPNESVDIDELGRVIKTEVLFLAELAAGQAR